MTQLIDYAADVVSQTGEDGIIARILELLEIDQDWCVEFGAWDGQHLSNTYNLISNHSWSGVLIEGDEIRLAEAHERYAGREDVHCLHRWVDFEGPNSLDSVLEETPLPKDFALLSIDIDGADYHVWDSLRRYRPKVVVVEFNPAIPNAIDWVQARDLSVYQGNSLAAFVRLAKEKGYELAACLSFNAFFVVNDLYPLLNVEDNRIETLRPDSRFVTHLGQLFDGTLIIDGNRRLIWTEGEIDEALIQVANRGFVFGKAKPWQKFLLNKLWRFLVRRRLIR